MIREQFARRKQFSAVDVSRHLEFDADRFLRLLVRHGYLETVGKGIFQRAAWPTPAAFLQGEPIGLTYCVQTWFRYYLQQWITDSMSARPCLCRRPGGAILRALRRRTECFEVRRGHLRKLIELGQQVLHALEFHPQRAPIQIDIFGKLRPIVRRIHGDRDTRTRPQSPQVLQRFDQALPALVLQRKLRAGRNRFQLPQQGKAVDQKGAAGLIAAEVIEFDIQVRPTSIL